MLIAPCTLQKSQHGQVLFCCPCAHTGGCKLWFVTKLHESNGSVAEGRNYSTLISVGHYTKRDDGLLWKQTDQPRTEQLFFSFTLPEIESIGVTEIQKSPDNYKPRYLYGGWSWLRIKINCAFRSLYHTVHTCLTGRHLCMTRLCGVTRC